jgi:hypothetical protein
MDIGGTEAFSQMLEGDRGKHLDPGFGVSLRELVI